MTDVHCTAHVDYDPASRRGPAAIDHRGLLERYIRYVGLCEGTTYLSGMHRHMAAGDVVFTDAEWDELRRMSAASRHA